MDRRRQALQRHPRRQSHRQIFIRLAATPYIGRPTLKREARELAVPQTGYILTYSVSGDAIDILRIKREARR